MQKTAPTDHPVLEVIAERWSPRAFDPRPVSPDSLRSLFEAARWAASSFNDQPWTFVLARREDAAGFERALSCLSAWNRRWVRNAGALIFAVARSEFSRNGKPNRHASYDLGQAAAHLALQATALGLAAHPMAGFSADAVRDTYRVPPGFEPLTAIAVGHPGRIEELDESLLEAEMAPRSRKPQVGFVFEQEWGRVAFERDGV